MDFEEACRLSRVIDGSVALNDKPTIDRAEPGEALLTLKGREEFLPDSPYCNAARGARQVCDKKRCSRY